MLQKSITVDEFCLLPTGVAIARNGAFHIDTGVPPLAKIMMALPVVARGAQLPVSSIKKTDSAWLLGYDFLARNQERYLSLFTSGRMVSLGMLLTTCLLVYFFTIRLYGRAAAFLSLTLAVLSPNLIAHGRLATTDIYFTTSVVAALLLFDCFLEKPTLWRALALGLMAGISCLVKFTGLIFSAVLIFFLLCVFLWQSSHPGGRENNDLTVRRLLISLFVVILASLLIINAVYLFQGSFASLGDYLFASKFFNQVQALFPAWLPIPFPFYFIKGLDTQLAEVGYTAYLLGKFNHTGFWNYYLVGFLVKTPEPLIVLAMLALFFHPRIRLREFPLVMTVLFMTGFFSFAGHKNIGIRYLLFIFPLACIWSGRIMALPFWQSGKKRKPVVLLIAVALLWMFGSTAAAWPNYISFFNVISGGAKQGHNYLLDSNLDWGQDLVALRKYLDKEQITEIDLSYWGRIPPALYGIRHRLFRGGSPTSRYVVISANLLWGYMYFVNGTGFWPTNPDQYAVFRLMKPVEVIGNTLYVFDMELPR